MNDWRNASANTIRRAIASQLKWANLRWITGASGRDELIGISPDNGRHGLPTRDIVEYPPDWPNDMDATRALPLSGGQVWQFNDDGSADIVDGVKIVRGVREGSPATAACIAWLIMKDN